MIWNEWDIKNQSEPIESLRWRANTQWSIYKCVWSTKSFQNHNKYLLNCKFIDKFMQYMQKYYSNFHICPWHALFFHLIYPALRVTAGRPKGIQKAPAEPHRVDYAGETDGNSYRKRQVWRAVASLPGPLRLERFYPGVVTDSGQQTSSGNPLAS